MEKSQAEVRAAVEYDQPPIFFVRVIALLALVAIIVALVAAA